MATAATRLAATAVVLHLFEEGMAGGGAGKGRAGLDVKEGKARNCALRADEFNRGAHPSQERVDAYFQSFCSATAIGVQL